MATSGMSQSSRLPYDPPFRYTPPARDLQAMFGAQIGNPRLVPVEKAKPGKRSTPGKKRASAPAVKLGKAGKPKASAPVAPKRAMSKAKAKTNMRRAKR